MTGSKHHQEIGYLNENKCNKINEKMKQEFYTIMAKGLFLCKRARLEIQTVILFLTNRVKETDKDDKNY